MPNIAEMFPTMQNRGNPRATPGNSVAMCVYQNGYIAVKVGKDIMQACRWLMGDMVTIDMDPARSELTIRRVPASEKNTVRWTLSGSTEGRGTATFKFKATPLMVEAFGMDDAYQPYIPDTVITDAKGVVFPMRKQWTVHNHPPRQA